MPDILIEYSRNAEKFFIRHEDIREIFRHDLLKIIKNDHPEQVNFKNLKGKLKGYSRIAVGSYRIIFKIYKNEIVIVSVIYAGARGDIYKHVF